MLSHRGFFDLAQVREDYRGVESAASDSAGCDRER